MLGKVWSWNSLILLVGMLNAITMVENNLPIPQKSKHIITKQLNNFPPRYMPRGIESRDLNRCLYTNVHCSIIHSSQKMKTTQVSMNKWMDKQNVVYTYSAITFSLKKGRNSFTCLTMDEPWGHYAKWGHKKSKTVWFLSKIVKFMETK